MKTCNKICSSLIYPLIAAALTIVIANISQFTCLWIFHQPQMPDELDDFRKYAD